MVIDELRLSNWLRTKDGAKGRNRPSPVSPLYQKGKKIGGTEMTNEEVFDYLDKLHKRGKYKVA